MDKYGLVGYPLGHSFSRDFFNEKFKNEGINAEYVNFEIPSIERFPEIITENANLCGLNVTIPYKKLVMEYCSYIDPHAKAINAVNTIVDARRVYIQGAMSSGILASFMHYYLRLIFDKVTLIGSVATSEIYQQMIHIGEGDVFIGLSFPRYAKSTINACKFAHDCGSQIIAITDSENSPLAQYAHTTLCAYSDMVSFVDSLVAPMSLLNALIVAVSNRNRCRVEQTFRKLETLWDNNDVYKKDV